jgi:non-homologous end joining protein Ku
MKVSKNQFEDLSRKSLDMLINSTLNKHKVKLKKPKKMSMKEKQEIRKLVEDLKKSVESLTKKNN